MVYHFLHPDCRPDDVQNHAHFLLRLSGADQIDHSVNRPPTVIDRPDTLGAEQKQLQLGFDPQIVRGGTWAIVIGLSLIHI